MTENLQQLLLTLRACETAREWARTISPCSYQYAWEACGSGDWLLWVAYRLGVDWRLVAKASCACARHTLDYIPAEDERPLRLLEMVEDVIRGEGSVFDLGDASNRLLIDQGHLYSPAGVYARNAVACAATFVIEAEVEAEDEYKAKRVLSSSVLATFAGDATLEAAAAVDADVNSVAHRAALRRSAGIVRGIIPWDTMWAALEKLPPEWRG